MGTANFISDAKIFYQHEKENCFHRKHKLSRGKKLFILGREVVVMHGRYFFKVKFSYTSF